MGKRVLIAFLDDLDESKSADETVIFGLDGVSYEIDLTTKNAAALRKDLAGWVENARRVGGRKIANRPPRATPVTRGKSGAVPPGVDTGAVRQWAVDNGYEVSERGRIAQDVQRAYLDAH